MLNDHKAVVGQMFKFCADVTDSLVGRDRGRVNAECPRCDVVTYLWRYAA